MKTNKKVLVILLALAGTQSATLAERCKQISQNPSISVCVTATNLTDTVDRTTFATLKQTAVNLLAAEKRALAKRPKAILAPKVIPSVIIEEKEEDFFNNLYEDPGVPTLPADEKPEGDPWI